MLVLNPGLFSFSSSNSARKPGGNTGELNRSSPRGVPYHRTSQPVRNWGQLARRGQSLLRNKLGISQRVVSNCTFFPGGMGRKEGGQRTDRRQGLFICHHPPLHFLLYFTFISIIKLFLSQHTGFNFFPNSFPHPPGE